MDPTRVPKVPRGLKARSTLHRVTLNPSSANPGETLYVTIPQLSQDVVILPGSVSLVFDLEVGGHANRTPVNNLARNLISRMRVTFGGEALSDTQRHDLFSLLSRPVRPKDRKRTQLVQEGISSENMRKLRSDAGDKDTSDAKEVALSAILGTKYRIPLDHPILTDHGVFYPRGLRSQLKFELTLAPVSDVLVYSDTVKTPSYSLSDIELEYTCVTNEALAIECASQYQIGKGFQYENVLLHKTFIIDSTNDTVINENVNVPRRSITGILLLFTDAYSAGERNSSKFIEPKHFVRGCRY